MKIFDINKLADTLFAYVETKVELFKLDVRDQSVKYLSKLLIWTLIMLSFGTFLFFLSIGAALWLNELLDNNFLGYLIVGGFYLIVGLLFLGSRKSLEERVYKNVGDSIKDDEAGSDDERQENTSSEQ